MQLNKNKLREFIQDNAVISMQRLAKETGISRQTLWYIMSKDNQRIPSMLIVKKICKYFNEDYKKFYEEK